MVYDGTIELQSPLSFMTAPPNIEYLNRTRFREPRNLPYKDAPGFMASLYYWWWAFLQRNTAYKRTCRQSGHGRLRSVLGQRTGYEQPQDNQVKESFADKGNAPIPFPKAADNSAKISGSGLEVLRRADRQFNEKEFVQGATAAFEMIRQTDIMRKAYVHHAGRYARGDEKSRP